MTVESTTQALCDLALRFGEGDEESMVGNSTYHYDTSFISLLIFYYNLWCKHMYPFVYESDCSDGIQPLCVTVIN